MMMTQIRGIAINSLNNALYQMEQTGTLQAMKYQDLNKFSMKSEVQIFNSYELVLNHGEQTISIFIKDLNDPHGAVVININGQPSIDG